jgi:hypothetical protein
MCDQPIKKGNHSPPNWFGEIPLQPTTWQSRKHGYVFGYRYGYGTAISKKLGYGYSSIYFLLYIFMHIFLNICEFNNNYE